MKTRHRRAILPLVSSLCALAVALAGCGQSETLSDTEANRALTALDSIEELIDEGRCTAAQRRVQLLITQASNVNEDRPDLGAAYAESAQRLQELVNRECVEVTESGPTEEATGETGPTDEPTKETTEPTPEQTQPQAPPNNGGGAPQQPQTPPNDGGEGNDGGGGDEDNGSGGVRPG